MAAAIGADEGVGAHIVRPICIEAGLDMGALVIAVGAGAPAPASYRAWQTTHTPLCKAAELSKIESLAREYSGRCSFGD
jgi:hypothetical protein